LAIDHPYWHMHPVLRGKASSPKACSMRIGHVHRRWSEAVGAALSAPDVAGDTDSDGRS
jgi:hypothetical protein